MKKFVFLLTIAALLTACTQPPVTPTSTPEPPPTEQPLSTPVPEEPSEIVEPPLPVLPSERDHHPYNWQPEDVKGLDPWGDSASDDTDIIAVYQRQNEGILEFRLDLLDLQEGVTAPIYFAIDFQDGGTTQITPENGLMSFDIEWDLLVSIDGGDFVLYEPAFTDISEQLLSTEINSQLDFIFLSISDSALSGWDGSAFLMQPLLLDDTSTAVLDQIAPVSTDGSTGRAKLVIPTMNAFIGTGPHAVGWYDGFDLRPNERPGERRGFRYLLDAVERYEIPITLNDLRIETLAANEYLRINERIRHLSSNNLIDPLTTLGYGHFMPWQPNDVDARAIEITTDLRAGLELPVSEVFYPYEGMLTPGDIQVIKDAGFEVIFGIDQSRYSFLGWMDDWSDPAAFAEGIESIRKIHEFNGIKFVFHTAYGNDLGFVTDERWEEIAWEEFDEYYQYLGTDNGLDLWWRRILHDMAVDPDQEQFFTIGTDILLTPWLFPDVVEWNFQWLASHPWIEVTTFTSIVTRGWEVVEHGDVNLAPDEVLMRFPKEGDWYYNAYFPQHYYGGISDGLSPLVPAGVQIEAYYDYVPYLKDGELIPSGRIMGDAQTPGSIVYETLANLRNAPSNPLTTLAWLAYFNSIGEQTFHEGEALFDGARVRANFMGQVNKITAAASWAEQAAQGTLPSDTQVIEEDLDLDGELEYVMSNDRVFAVFENDGGRLEYAFVYDTQYGPVQVIAPQHQYRFLPSPDSHDYRSGEAATSLAWPDIPDGAFVEDLDSDGQFEYAPLQASIDGQSLTFAYEAYPVTKRFTLEGDTIHVHYDLGTANTINLGFANAVNLLGVFDSNWIANFESIQSPEVIGWQMASGGSVLLNIEQGFAVQTASFSDSPAREEMRAREDGSTYTEGHWMCFPCSWIRVWDASEVDYSLTLGAAPVD